MHGVPRSSAEAHVLLPRRGPPRPAQPPPRPYLYLLQRRELERVRPAPMPPPRARRSRARHTQPRPRAAPPPRPLPASAPIAGASNSHRSSATALVSPRHPPAPGVPDAAPLPAAHPPGINRSSTTASVCKPCQAVRIKTQDWASQNVNQTRS